MGGARDVVDGFGMLLVGGGGRSVDAPVFGFGLFWAVLGALLVLVAVFVRF